MIKQNKIREYANACRKIYNINIKVRNTHHDLVHAYQLKQKIVVVIPTRLIDKKKRKKAMQQQIKWKYYQESGKGSRSLVIYENYTVKVIHQNEIFIYETPGKAIPENFEPKLLKFLTKILPVFEKIEIQKKSKVNLWLDKISYTIRQIKRKLFGFNPNILCKYFKCHTTYYIAIRKSKNNWETFSAYHVDCDIIITAALSDPKSNLLKLAPQYIKNSQLFAGPVKLGSPWVFVITVNDVAFDRRNELKKLFEKLYASTCKIEIERTTYLPNYYEMRPAFPDAIVKDFPADNMDC